MDYSENYIIRTPQLKSDAGSTIRIHPNLGNITYCFDNHILEEFGLFSTTFCFFILWGNGLVGELNRDAIWIKKEIHIEPNEIINLNSRSFDAKLLQDEPVSIMHRRITFFEKNGLNASYIIIRDLADISNIPSSSYVAFFVRYDTKTGHLSKERITFDALCQLLVRHSNKKMHINKPLNYYETKLEKVLADTSKDTGALFPGDCDMLLFDGNNKCRFIIEFKKTTYRDNLPLNRQSFLNYINADRNKYTRLNILRNYFSSNNGSPVPFVTVFFSLREPDQVKIETISPSLKVEQSRIINTSSTVHDNQKHIIHEIIKMSNNL